MSDKYFNGVWAFIDIAKNYTNEKGLVRYPCRKCVWMCDVIDEDETLEDYVDEELGEDDSEIDKEFTSDEHLEYYSETDDD